MDNIIETLRYDGYGNTPEEKGQWALDNYFDVRQDKAEAIQEYINREEMMSPLQNAKKIALDEKMRGYWLIRTSALSEQEIAGIRIVTEGVTGLSAVKRAIQQKVVSRRREEVREKTGCVVITFTPSPTVRNLSQRQIWTVRDR